MITLDEFERVQRLLHRQGPTRAKTHEFAYTGMIRCGECGLTVTAEEHVNRFGSHYTYYRCTKRRLDHCCRQRYIEVRKLEQQIREFFTEISISDRMHHWALAKLSSLMKEKQSVAEVARSSMARILESLAREGDNLITLRLRDLLSDDEFLARRQETQLEQLRIKERLTDAAVAERWFEPAKLFVTLSNRAVSWFDEGDPQTKRLILQIIGSNLLLKDQKLSIEERKPFRRWSKTESFPELLAVFEDVRTLSDRSELSGMAEAIRQICILRGDGRKIIPDAA